MKYIIIITFRIKTHSQSIKTLGITDLDFLVPHHIKNTVLPDKKVPGYYCLTGEIALINKWEWKVGTSTWLKDSPYNGRASDISAFINVSTAKLSSKAGGNSWCIVVATMVWKN